jgi:glycosyltransferase involved in cell wall biosynthesis/LmbE family N-acetylglucosaminyl deacetylase
MAIANEQDLFSAVMTAFPPVRKVLVIAPHPDDEVFGCGGTVSLLRGSGCVVTTIIVTDGALGGDNTDGELIETRAEESRAAADRLKLDAPIFWGLPDRGVEYGEVLIGRLVETLLEADADLVFLPSPTEWHPDHQAIAFAGAEAIRRLGGERRAAFYEISAPLPSANLIFDISMVEEEKRQAMRCFHSQLRELPYDTRISGINSYRALHLGAQARSAEAFTLLAATDLEKGGAILLDGPLAHRRNLGFATSGGDMPLVSVIIRSMDRPTLADALDSLALQTYSNIEVVLINAKGSGHRKAGQWCGRFPLRFIDSDEPLRRSRAANKGLDAAHGEYLMFLDDDDWFDVNHIQDMATAIGQHPETKVVYTGVRCVDEKKNPLPNKFDAPFDAVQIVAGNFIPIHAVLFSRSLIELGCRLDESLDLYEDWDFWIQLSRHCDFLRIDGLSAVYRITQHAGFGVNADPAVAASAALVLYKKWFNRLGDCQITGLMQTVRNNPQKDGQISGLHQAVAERDLQIARLDQTVADLSHGLTERDKQVAILSETVTEREVQLARLEQAVVNLNRGVTERDGQVGSLNQTVTERDRQITNLTQAITQRDMRVAGLDQAVTERDQQIASLKQTVAERDRQIASLGKAMAERDSVIRQILASTSWRLTRPLRFIKSFFASNGDSTDAQETSLEHFDAEWYLNQNPDVAMSGMDPYEHFVLYGRTEGRQPAPDAFLLRSIKRARRILAILPAALRQSGGCKPTIRKVLAVLRREGWEGVKRRVNYLHSQEPHSAGFDRNDYSEWVRRYDTLTDGTRATMRANIDGFGHKPLISVVMPTYNPKTIWLIEAIESVRRQIYPHWELCIADDASTDKAVRPILERYANEDSRIKVTFREKNGHISVSSNTALRLATGSWVALLDHDDLLSERALFEVADAINKNPDIHLIYSDEDKIDEDGRRFDPYFKCEWNEDLFYSHNMFSHLGTYHTELLRKIGGFRVGMEGSQDYDLALRCIENIESNQIHHIPRVLYHWRMHAESTAQSADAKPYAMLAGERALNEHFRRQKIDAKAELIGYGYRVRYSLPEIPPLVSLIIPTRNGLSLIRNCVESVLQKTTYPNYEILIVDNGSDDPATLEYLITLKAEARVRVVRDDRPFNYSALNNAAAKLVRGDVLGLLNNDLEVISPEWLSEMVSIALQQGLGAVGARLWYQGETLQHGGIILGLGASGIAGHAHHHMSKGHHGYFGRASLISSFSAISAACLVIRKEIYEEVCGLNETDLQVGFNDVDFCLRLREKGYRNVWTPNAELYHHESATRGYEDTPEKIARFGKEVHYMKQRWGNLLSNDPAYSPNLTLNHADFSLAWPPRGGTI